MSMGSIDWASPSEVLDEAAEFAEGDFLLVCENHGNDDGDALAMFCLVVEEIRRGRAVLAYLDGEDYEGSFMDLLAFVKLTGNEPAGPEFRDRMAGS